MENKIMRKRKYKGVLLAVLTAAVVVAGALMQSPTLAGSKGDRTFGRESSVVGSNAAETFGRESSIASARGGMAPTGRESS